MKQRRRSGQRRRIRRLHPRKRTRRVQSLILTSLSHCEICEANVQLLVFRARLFG